MTHAKIAISLPPELAASARAAVKRGHAASVSAFVAAAVREKVQASELKSLLDELLAETGGAPTAAEIAATDRALGLPPAAGRKRR
jgi:Arc/MetJ-type ribon-helix-helix transcriptional regulator